MSESKDIVEPRADIVDRLAMMDVGLHREAIPYILALRSALRECADDLAGEINARCPPELRKGPDAQRKYERDMKPVNRARALLSNRGEE